MKNKTLIFVLFFVLSTVSLQANKLYHLPHTAKDSACAEIVKKDGDIGKNNTDHR